MFSREIMFLQLYQDALKFYHLETGSDMSKSMILLVKEGLTFVCLELQENWARNYVTDRAAQIAYFWIGAAKEKSKVGLGSLSFVLETFLREEGVSLARNSRIQDFGKTLREIIDLDLNKDGEWKHKSIQVFLDVRIFLESCIATKYIGSQENQLMNLVKQQDFNDTNQLLNLVNQWREHRILILGSYSKDGIQRIRLIEEDLSKKGLLPVVFCDLEGIANVVEQNKVTEEVNTVANLCQFVIMEDSEPSGHLIELTYLNVNMITTAILRKEGMGSTILTKSFLKKNAKFIKEFSYLETNLSSILDDVITWARSI